VLALLWLIVIQESPNGENQKANNAVREVNQRPAKRWDA
jgi:hypothetical protein